jgi:PAS domain S-box-containing protein
VQDGGDEGRDKGRDLRDAEQDEALSAAILRGLPGIFYMFDERGRYVRWNARFEEAVGFHGDEVLSKHPLDFFEGPDRELIEQRIGKVFADGVGDAEADLLHRSGRRTPFYFTGVRTVIGGKVYLAGTGVDLSAVRLAERARARAEAWQRTMLDSAELAIVSTDTAGVIQSYNKAAERLFGHTAEEMIGVRTPVIVHLPEELAARAAALSVELGRAVSPDFDVFVAEARQGERTEREWTCVRKDGSRFPARVSVTPMVGAGGECVGYLGVVVDLTEQRRRETLMRLQSAALEAAADAILIADARGVVEWVNPAFSRLTGRTREDAVGRPLRALRSGLQPETFYDAQWAAISRGEVWRAEVVGRRPDASLYHAQQTITPLRDASGALTHFVLTEQDVSERKRAELDKWKLEEQLRVSEKLRAVGSLAGGIAHDFNNLLGVILTYAEVAMDGLPPDAPLRDDLAHILSAGARAAELTRQLLAFSRKQVLRVESVSLNQVVTGLEKMLRRLLGEHIELRTDLAPGLGTTRADPGQLEQVLVNLAVNARDAMPTGGRLTITTREVDADAARGLALPGLAPGAYVRLTVADTGVGMDAATRQRIFEPFFTTKEQGKGTGLGLSTVHGIVEQSGGCVDVTSEPGRGTTFDVYLPREERGAAAAGAATATRQRTGGTETVLVVDDERQVRVIVERVLRAQGYTVLGASDGVEALEVARQYGGPIHLLLTDVLMPRMTGKALADALAAERPGVRALYMSGFADDALVTDGALGAGLHFVAKPFGVGELLAKVREALDA